MAEKSIQFNAKKEIFDRAAARLACSDCKVVPKVVPIFQTSHGDVLCSICKTKRSSNSSNNLPRRFLCSICKPKSKSSEIFRSFVLEDLLRSLPISCKYQKNECPVVLQDRKSLSYHEKDCEFRDILCPYRSCNDVISANRLGKHFLVNHKFDLEQNFGLIEMSEIGMYKFDVKMDKKKFDSDRCLYGTIAYIYNDSKTFLTHLRLSKGYNFMWIQLMGSQFEAKNFEYSLKVDGPPDIGKFYYEGAVRSLDDDKIGIFETGLGLNLPHRALKKLVQDDRYYVEVKIRDLKAEINKSEDSQIAMPDKEDD